MKNNVALLLKIQLMRVFNPAFLKNNRDRKKKQRMALFLAGAVLVSLLMMSYSAMMAKGYVYMGQGEVVPRLMLGLCSLFVLVFTFLRSNGAMFGGTDFDQVISLPIEIWQVVTAKTLTAYFTGLFVFLVFDFPALLVYGIYMKPSVSGMLSLLVLLLAGPVLPVIVGLVLGTLILALTCRLRRRQFFSMVLNVAFLVAVLVWSGSLSAGGEQKLMDMGNMISGMIGRIYPPAVWAVSLAEGRGITGMLGFLILSGAGALLFVAAVSRGFLKVNSALESLKKSAAAKVRFGKASSVFMALYKKEQRRLFSSTIYAMNTLTGQIMMLLASAAVLFMKAETIEKALEIPGAAEYISSLFPFVLAMLASMTATTSCSLSLEGRSRWVMCSLPVRPAEIFRAKIALNLSFAIPACVVSAVCFCIRFQPGLLQGLAAFFTPMAYSVFASVTGMFVNVKFPSYDWTHERQAVKNSMSVMISMVAGMAASLVPFFAAMKLPGYGTAISLAAGLFVLVIAGVLYIRLGSAPLYE